MAILTQETRDKMDELHKAFCEKFPFTKININYQKKLLTEERNARVSSLIRILNKLNVIRAIIKEDETNIISKLDNEIATIRAALDMAIYDANQPIVDLVHLTPLQKDILDRSGLKDAHTNTKARTVLYLQNRRLKDSIEHDRITNHAKEILIKIKASIKIEEELS